MRLFVVIGLRGYGDLARFYVNSLKMWVVKNTIESCTFVRIFVIVCIFLTLHSRNTLSPLYPRQRCNAPHGNFTRLRLSRPWKQEETSFVFRWFSSFQLALLRARREQRGTRKRASTRKPLLLRHFGGGRVLIRITRVRLFYERILSVVGPLLASVERARPRLGDTHRKGT